MCLRLAQRVVVTCLVCNRMHKQTTVHRVAKQNAINAGLRFLCDSRCLVVLLQMDKHGALRLYACDPCDPILEAIDGCRTRNTTRPSVLSVAARSLAIAIVCAHGCSLRQPCNACGFVVALSHTVVVCELSIGILAQNMLLTRLAYRRQDLEGLQLWACSSVTTSANHVLRLSTRASRPYGRLTALS